MTKTPTSIATEVIRPFYDGKSVLITGGSGYLGTAIVAALSGSRCRIRVLSRGARQAPEADSTKIEIVRGSTVDHALIRDLLADCDVVFHLAAQTDVYFAEQNPYEDFMANVSSTTSIVTAARHVRQPVTVIFAGTSTQVGMPTDLPVDETFPDNPVTVYDRHKLIAETYLKFAAAQGWVRGVSLRLPNLFGPGPDTASPNRGVLNRMAQRALAGERLTIYGTGDYLRDYLYVDDAATAHLLAGAAGQTLSGRHFFLGSGRGITIGDAFRLVAARAGARLGRRIDTVSVDAPDTMLAIEFRNFVANINAFQRASGWTPRITLEAGIDRLIDDLLDRGRAEAS